MPDALSTTIPIWCTVLNLALLPNHPCSSQLFLPPSSPPSTHAQITTLLPSFLASLHALNLTLPTCLTKPLRPFWVTQDSPLNDDPIDAIFDDYRPVICCTASRRVVGSEIDEGGYVQGAGDDTENWAHGLIPPVFWEHADELLETSEDDLLDLISQLLEEHKMVQHDDRRQLTPHISVSSLPIPNPSEYCIALTQESTPKETWVKSPIQMEIGLGKNKTASRNLRLALPEICAHATRFFTSQTTPGQILVACESGKDLSVGAALAVSCYLFDENGNFRIPDNVTITKTMVKIKLGGIMTAYPEANPSRQTLQSVNSFLMDWKR